MRLGQDVGRPTRTWNEPGPKHRPRRTGRLRDGQDRPRPVSGVVPSRRLPEAYSEPSTPARARFARPPADPCRGGRTRVRAGPRRRDGEMARHRQHSRSSGTNPVQSRFSNAVKRWETMGNRSTWSARRSSRLMSVRPAPTDLGFKSPPRGATMAMRQAGARPRKDDHRLPPWPLARPYARVRSSSLEARPQPKCTRSPTSLRRAALQSLFVRNRRRSSPVHQPGACPTG